MKRKQSSQQGFILIAAIVLIVILGFIAATVSYTLATESASASDQIDYEQAYLVSDAGLQRAQFRLLTSDLNHRIACQNITANSDFFEVPFTSGVFTVTGVLHDAAASPFLYTALSATITAGAAIIPVNDLSKLASSGRVMLDREVIDYQAVSTDASQCSGVAPCLIGIKRGANGTLAAAHNEMTAVAQKQCQLLSVGDLPNVTHPIAQKDLAVTVPQVSEAWVAGDRPVGSNEVIGTWNGQSWQRQAAQPTIPNVHLRGIALLSYADMWAVGNRNAGNALLLHWNGNFWVRVLPTSVVNQVLRSVYCYNGQYCWAVGNERTFLGWDGASWSPGKVKVKGKKDEVVPKKIMRGVSCSDPSNCWAVGDNDKGALLVRLKGAEWKRFKPDKSVKDVDLNSVFCNADGTCWAVGDRISGPNDVDIDYWNGAKWVGVRPSQPRVNLRSVFCNTSSDCWAVGDNQGGKEMILHFGGGALTSWSRILPVGSTADQDLLAVSCANNKNCWAVGDRQDILHWNGTDWRAVSPGNLPNDELRTVAAIAPNMDYKQADSWKVE